MTAWDDAIALFAIAQRVSKAPGTVAKQLEHVRRFAAESHLPPWQVEHEHFLDWQARRLEAGWSPSTLRVGVSSVRAFYRWAYTSNRVGTDPTLTPSRRVQAWPTPAAWEPELLAYRQALRGDGKSPETIRTRFNAVRRYARENASQHPYDVRLDDILDWFGGKRWAPETRKLHRDALRSFYQWALDTERTTVSPAAKLKPIRASGALPRPVEDDAYAAALAKADRTERLALRLGAELGLRRGEVVQVHSRDFELHGAAMTLRVNGKGRKTRRVPVPPDLAQTLRAADPGWLFPGGADGHMSPGYMGKRISDLLPAGVTMHALRHRFATRVYSITQNTLATQRLLGHASPATTQRYVAIPQDELRELVTLASTTDRKAS